MWLFTCMCALQCACPLRRCAAYTSPECITAPHVSNMMSDDKWGKEYLGGEDAAPGNTQGATGGGGYSFACSVSESGEIQGCSYGASG
jgi:hypothetical protein